MKLFKLTLAVLICGSSLLAKEAIKEAFLEGINETIKVMDYERKNQSESIPQGYCVQLKAINRDLHDNEIIKMESLALFFKLKPAFLKSQNEKKLCMAIANNVDSATKIIKKIKKDYPKINKYIVKAEILSSLNYHREIPIIGFISEDLSPQPQKILLNMDITTVYKDKNILVKDSGIKNLYTIEKVSQ